MAKTAQISAKIPREQKERIRMLVSKGAFPTMSDFYRMAISRLLGDLETYTKTKRIKRYKEEKKVEEKKDEKDMKEIIDFVEEFY
jgi:Arc/MetJ-type ribon-helix-helix transcriptional regulator